MGISCPGVLPTVNENLPADAFPVPLSRKVGLRPFGLMGSWLVRGRVMSKGVVREVSPESDLYPEVSA